MELANDAELRVTAPREPEAGKTVQCRVSNGSPAPLPGSRLTRQYKGRLLQVTVLADGFEFDSERYRPLSAIAKAVTGAHWSGYRFFGLQQGGAA
jgi:hypothetical protein